MEAETDPLRTELALLTNGYTNGHSGMTNGDEPSAEPANDSYETTDPRTSQEARGAIGHPAVTNGSPGEPPADAFHSY